MKRLKRGDQDILKQAAHMKILDAHSGDAAKKRYLYLKHMERLMKDPNKESHPMLITQNDIDSVKSIPIEDVHDFTAKKKVGRSIFVSCPFHEDKTPSMKINSINTYHCFSCAAHGDVINLIMQIRKIDFKEAVRWLKTHHLKTV